MIINRNQFNALGNEMFKKFIGKLTDKISVENPDWMQNEDRERKGIHIKNIVEYGQRVNIIESNSLELFASYLIKFNQNIPLKPIMVDELKNTSIKEEIRIERLYLKLANGRENLTLIKLN